MKIEVCKVLANRKLADNLWKLDFEAPGITNQATGPGQFIEILIDEGWERPLRRPMSIADIDGDKLSIIYKTFGSATKSLTRLITGDRISITGPLGNTFDLPDQHSEAIIVGGGVGLAPVLWFKNHCDNSGIYNNLIIGARTAGEHFLPNDHASHIYLTTDDGSIGDHGTVMGRLEKIVSSSNDPTIYACGPKPMLMAIQEYSLANRIPAQLSVESYMACGIGICQGCVIKKSNHSSELHTYHAKYSLVCKEGPVYNAEEIHFG